jgi:hypothetical protein
MAYLYYYYILILGFHDNKLHFVVPCGLTGTAGVRYGECFRYVTDFGTAVVGHHWAIVWNRFPANHFITLSTAFSFCGFLLLIICLAITFVLVVTFVLGITSLFISGLPTAASRFQRAAC